jgi:hypothetical protein
LDRAKRVQPTVTVDVSCPWNTQQKAINKFPGVMPRKNM